MGLSFLQKKNRKSTRRVLNFSVNILCRCGGKGYNNVLDYMIIGVISVVLSTICFFPFVLTGTMVLGIFTLKDIKDYFLSGFPQLNKGRHE